MIFQVRAKVIARKVKFIQAKDSERDFDLHSSCFSYDNPIKQNSTQILTHLNLW